MKNSYRLHRFFSAKRALGIILVLGLFILNACRQAAREVSDPSLFSDYITYNSSGELSALGPVMIQLKEPLEQEAGEELSSKYYSLSPKAEGTLTVDDEHTLIFTPRKALRPDTEYSFTLNLEKLYSDIEEGKNKYTFSFATIRPEFSLNMEYLQSYSKDWQYLTGTLHAADHIPVEKLPDLVDAFQNDKALSIKWDTLQNSSNTYNFVVDSIHREEDDSYIDIRWDGRKIQSKTEGESQFLIPGADNFDIVGMKVHSSPEASLSINFSDRLNPDQNFEGLVQIEGVENLRYEAEDNVLHVYPPKRLSGDMEIQISPGIEGVFGNSLKQQFSDKITFEELKPQVKLISKGVILPEWETTPLYFKAVNLSAVDVRIIKIYPDNILQFLQEHDLESTSVYGMNRVGRLVAKKTIQLNVGDQEKGNWKAFAVNLSEFFEADRGAVYRVEFGFRPSYSTYGCEVDEEDSELASFEEEQEENYWNNEADQWYTRIYDWEHQDDPCYRVYYQPDNFASTNIMGSDLGLIAKKNSDHSYRFYTTSLVTAKPVKAEISLFNYQQQKLETINTDVEGKAEMEAENDAVFAIARSGEDYAFVKLDDGSSLSMSKFDVSGKEIQKGLKGFMYTERGVYRPGDTIHLAFAINDKLNPLPEDVPVKLEVTNAVGKLVQQTIATAKEKTGRDWKSENGMYYFPIPTRDEDETGTWNAKISVGGAHFTKNITVATVKPNRLKIELDFDHEVLRAQQPISGEVTGSWLYGAPAKNLKVEMEATLNPTKTAFDAFEDYEFTDPVRDFNEVEMAVLDTALSAAGKARFNQSMELNGKAPGMLKATFLTKVFEGGGDFSMDVFSKDLAPYSYFVGLKSPEPHRYGSLYTDEKNTFQVVSVDEKGKVAPNRQLEVRVYKVEWRWWWSRSRDQLSEYEEGSSHRPFKSMTVSTNKEGKGEFTVNVPEEERGRYLVRVIDKASGHATGITTYFYKNWDETPGDGEADNAKMLVFSADKESYKIGEKAKITFPSDLGGRALVSVENGSEVVSSQWVDAEKGETKVEIPITREMTPTAYINISLLQPYHQVENDLPIRLYGVIPLKVKDEESFLEPVIDMPKTLKPDADFQVKVSDKKGKAMTYTIAVVDEGLLDLTRFETPDIHQSFYSREALGVRTFDLFDEVIGAFSGSVNNIYEIGGDDFAESGKKNKANRFVPVVRYLGPFQLEAGETFSHRISMPNYIGSVRTMVIAGDRETGAYGNAEKTTPVSKPLMLLASLPRKLSPGETVTLPITVFTMGKKVKDPTISVRTTPGLEPVGETTKTVHFDEPGDQIVNFEYQVKATDEVQKITVNASGSGEKASYEVEVDAVNPNPIDHKVTQYQVGAKETNSISYKRFGVAGTDQSRLEFSTLPPMDFTKRLQYLIHYPHGCVEQTTSTGFPQLYLDKLFDLTADKKLDMKHNVKAVIERVGRAQLTDGSLPFWPGGGQTDSWVTSYAGQFMLEAKAQGYVLPVSFLSNWLEYQQRAARQWNPRAHSYNTTFDQAYRLYTLALADQPDLSSMNRLKGMPDLTNSAKWRLALAYAKAGKKEVAQEIAATASSDLTNHRDDRYTYGSVFRNRAMALETMVALGDPQQRKLAESLAKTMTSDRWLSTQETSFALLAMTEMVEKNGGKDMDLTYTENGKEVHIQTDKAMADRELAKGMESGEIKIVNHKDNQVYVNLYQEGRPALGEEERIQNGLSIVTRYTDAGGNTLQPEELHQGTEIMANVTVLNQTEDRVEDVALTQIFPSGWEIINTDFTDLKGTTGDADYTDIRDDRVHFYFDLQGNKAKSFSVKLNASYLGKYYLPGVQAEAMYDHRYNARSKGKWIRVIP